jgi:hypothetical protein
MTDKGNDRQRNPDWPGDEIPGKLQDEMHHGAEAAIDMNEYAKSDAERVATGQESLEEALTDTDDPGPT